MRRFTVNRWWAFILALVLGLAAVTALSGSLKADPVMGDDGGGSEFGNGGGGGSGAPPAGVGDPDIPTKSSQVRGASRRSFHGVGARTAGDSGVSAKNSDWTWRFSVVFEAILRRYTRI
jgi:hypothetical protein